MLEIRTEPLRPAEWLGVIEREYFKDFLHAGGAAAKFVIGDEAAQEEIQTECAVLARRHGLLHAHLSAAETKLHMAQEMFFALVRVLPWDGLLQRYLEELFSRHEHPWPRTGTALSTAELADALHMTTVSRNRARLSSGVMTIGNADSADALTMTRPMLAASENPMTALSSAWQMMTL